MKISELKKSRFLTKDDVEPPIKVTIRGLVEENVAMDNQPAEMRWTLVFHEDIKAMVLNSINAQIIAKIAGSEETDDWSGAVIVLYNDPTVAFGGKIVGGIRVRAVRTAQRPQPQRAAPPPRPAQKPVEFDQAMDRTYGAGDDPVEDDIPF